MDDECYVDVFYFLQVGGGSLSARNLDEKEGGEHQFN